MDRTASQNKARAGPAESDSTVAVQGRRRPGQVRTRLEPAWHNHYKACTRRPGHRVRTTEAAGAQAGPTVRTSLQGRCQPGRQPDGVRLGLSPARPQTIEYMAGTGPVESGVTENHDKAGAGPVESMAVPAT